MTENLKMIDEKALSSLSVAPGNPDEETPIYDPRQNAGQDESIAERLESDPKNADAVLDTALDESMDASDPASATQPGDSGAPGKSSGFDPEAEAAILADRR